MKGRIGIDLGIQYSKNSYNNDWTWIIQAMGDPNMKSWRFNYSNQYINIPVRIKYPFIRKKLSIYGIIGLSPNFYLKSMQKETIEYYEGDIKINVKENTPLDANKVAFSILGGIGFSYNLKENLGVSLEPLYRYSLTAFKDAVLLEYQYSFGLQVRLTKGF